MMAKKRKDGVEIDAVVERNEVMELTRVAKSWDFTCSFCFKKFPSAQAMGGHQNAHRSQRMEEKRLFVRDPITYRKRAFLRAIKAGGSKKMAENETAVGAQFDAGCDCFFQPSSCEDSSADNSNGDENVVMIKELTVADHEEDHNLDLTLKL